MAWNDPSELFVASSGQVLSAPTGTALPANVDTTLNAAFEGLGFTTEDGVTISVTPNIVEHRAWQSPQPVRRDRDTQDAQFSVTLEQWNEATLPRAFGGGSVTDLGSGQYRYNPPADDAALEERAWVVESADGSREQRLIIPRGTVMEAVEFTWRRNELAVLPLTVKALEPTDGGHAWYLLSNDSAAFAAGS